MCVLQFYDGWAPRAVDTLSSRWAGAAGNKVEVVFFLLRRVGTACRRAVQISGNIG